MARKKSELVKTLEEQSNAQQHIQCDHESSVPCETSALCRVKTDAGWKRFCFDHYSAYFLVQARLNLGMKRCES